MKDTFFCFMSLLKGHKYKLRGLYLDEMPGMMIALHTLDRLLESSYQKSTNGFKWNILMFICLLHLGYAQCW